MSDPNDDTPQPTRAQYARCGERAGVHPWHLCEVYIPSRPDAQMDTVEARCECTLQSSNPSFAHAGDCPLYSQPAAAHVEGACKSVGCEGAVVDDGYCEWCRWDGSGDDPRAHVEGARVCPKCKRPTNDHWVLCPDAPKAEADTVEARQYRKRPVVVEATQTSVAVEIETLEGTMRADPGDYIITGVKGERYPCKPDIFDATYEAVTPTADVEGAPSKWARDRALEACQLCRYHDLGMPCPACAVLTKAFTVVEEMITVYEANDGTPLPGANTGGNGE